MGRVSRLMVVRVRHARVRRSRARERDPRAVFRLARAAPRVRWTIAVRLRPLRA